MARPRQVVQKPAGKFSAPREKSGRKQMIAEHLKPETATNPESISRSWTNPHGGVAAPLKPR
jgi:hypothetical protein